MTDEELKAIRERCEAATPGPWLPSIHGFQILTGDSWNTICVFWERSSSGAKFHHLPRWEDGRAASREGANCDFIAHAITDVPALLAEVERLRRDNWNLNYQIKGLRRRIHELEDELDGDDD